MVGFLLHFLRDTALMTYALLWPLVLGFAISAAFQAWLPRARVEAALGGRGPGPIVRAAALGALSSSCSYAAVAMARSLFVKGARAGAAFSFQFAATNVVWELAAALLALLGWQFALAELVGAVVVVALLAALSAVWVSPSVEARAREHAAAASGGHSHHAAGGRVSGWRGLGRRSAWLDLAFNFRGDWQMLYKEIGVGLVLAGLVAQLPSSVFSDLLLHHGGEPWRVVENVAVAPLIAVLTFVCSIGNVALAGVLWARGGSFAGVLAFLYADLLIVPILLIYRRYYGTRFALGLAASQYVALVATALLVSAGFSALGLTAHLARPPLGSLLGGVRVDGQLVANLVAVAVGLALFGATSRYGAKDPVCGMWVERERAKPLLVDGAVLWFCGDHCRHRYLSQRSAGDVAAQEGGVADRQRRQAVKGADPG